MKQYYALFAIMFLSGMMNTYAQDIQNNGFEDWSVIQYYEDPIGYSTTNVITFFSGSTPNVVKTSDAYSGTYAIHMETVDTPEGVYAGAAFIGTPGDDNFAGGIPYDERPDSLTGYVKYNVSPGDTAYVAAIFKKFGAPIGISFGQFSGVQDGYQYFSVPVEWLVPIISPDTLAIALISSSIFAEPLVGSSLTVDKVEFKGPGDPFPNGEFEDWIEFSSEEPDSWQSSNLFSMPVSSTTVTKTTDSHSGNFAVKIESMMTSFNDTLGFITNGFIGEDGPAGGMPVEDVPAILSGYYKYFPVGPDTAIGGMTLYHYNTNTGVTETLDSAFAKFPPADTYTYFEVEVEYYSLPEPDTVNIAFGSGNFDEAAAYVGLGSTLYLDDLEITYKPHIVSTDEITAVEKPRLFPNPVRETLFIETFDVIRRPVQVDILDGSGQLVASRKSKSSGTFSFDVDQLPAGLYFYRITAGEQQHTGKFLVK